MKTLPSLTAFVLLVGCFSAWAQQGEPGKAAPLTIRAAAKLVVVDVVVTDKKHNRVHGLSKDDFLVTEGSARQTIRSFDEHIPAPSVEVAKAPPLPPGMFTNEQVAPKSAAVNVILIDALNTPMKDQPYLRAQVAAYLGRMKPGISLAVFELNSRLVMLQGFSSDPMVLKQTLEGKLPTRSVLLTDAAEQGSVAETITTTIEELGLDKTIPLAVMAKMQSTEDQQTSEQTQVRAKLTLDGLNVLARYLSGIPGRKNLIWFSGAFPVTIMPHTPAKYRDNADYDAFAQLGTSEREFRETTNLMTRSQVAVYPVDSRGLRVSSAINIQSSGAGMVYNPQRFGENEDDFISDTFDEHSTMERMAEDTGGRAYINGNDFAGAIESAVEDGTTYYTLSYTPTNTKWRGDLRSISVRLARSGYSLSYRHGYYADDPDSVTSALVTPVTDATGQVRGHLDDSDLLRVMGHGMPAATQVLYKASILPSAAIPGVELTNGSVAGAAGFAKAEAPFRHYRVGFKVDPKTVVLVKGEDGSYRGFLDFAAWVLDGDGKPVTTLSRQMQVVARAEQYERMTSQTIDFTVEISVPVKGVYSIRTGVLDIGTRRVGAMEVSVARVKDLPPVPVQAERMSPGLRSHAQ